MDRKKLAIMVVLALSLPILSGCVEKFNEVSGFDMGTIDSIKSERNQDAVPVVVSEKNPFYALIGTPVALYYDDVGRHVEPLLAENFDNPSKPVERFIDLYPAPYVEIRSGSAENVSIEMSEIWKKSDAALLIENTQHGYELGVVATPIASYLDIPVFVTNDTNNVRSILKSLGVKYTFVCGNLEGHGQTWRFENVDEITDFLVELVKNRFGDVGYITITNPLDITKVNVLNVTSYEFENTTASVDILPAQTVNAIMHGLFSFNSFVIPEDYKYARLKIDLIN